MRDSESHHAGARAQSTQAEGITGTYANSAKFIGLYNQIDYQLRVLLKLDKNPSFSEVIRLAKDKLLIATEDQVRLQQIGDLRNAIVHDRSYPIRVVAEPHDDLVDLTQTLWKRISGESSAYTIASDKFKLFDANDSVRSALLLMKANDFSQVIVSTNSGLNLLTTDGIASWVESNISDTGLLANDTAIAEVMKHERAGRFNIVARDRSRSEVQAIFESAFTHSTERLFALLVTHSGQSNQKCLGIITPPDVFSAMT